MRLNGDGPIVGLDLDGTLADYHRHFIMFAQLYTGRELPDPATINPAQPFRRFLGLGQKTYRECKLAYRQGGMKRSMPVFEHAADLSRAIRRDGGAEVWITTSRPYLQLGNVDTDTRHWLRRNGIQYDYLLWGENKYRDLSRQVGERVACVLEDLPEMIDQAFMSNLEPVIRTQPYNIHKTEGPKGEALVRVDDLKGAEEAILWKISEWRHNRGR